MPIESLFVHSPPLSATVNIQKDVDKKEEGNFHASNLKNVFKNFHWRHVLGSGFWDH